jgi:hypothetical protein
LNWGKNDLLESTGFNTGIFIGIGIFGSDYGFGALIFGVRA